MFYLSSCTIIHFLKLKNFLQFFRFSNINLDGTSLYKNNLHCKHFYMSLKVNYAIFSMFRYFNIMLIAYGISYKVTLHKLYASCQFREIRDRTRVVLSTYVPNIIFSPLPQVVSEQNMKNFFLQIKYLHT